MAGFQLVVLSERMSQDQNETSSLKGKKVLSIQKAKVLPVSSWRAVTEDLCACAEAHVHVWILASTVGVLGITDSLLVAGWSPVQRVANYKKCYVWWVGGRFWRLLLTQDSSSFESWIQRTASKLLNTSALCDLVDGTAGLIEACGRLFRTWINWIIVESFEYTSPFEEERLFYWRKPFVRGFKKFKKPSYCSYGPSVFILTISPSSCVKEMTIWFQQRKSFANSF